MNVAQMLPQPTPIAMATKFETEIAISRLVKSSRLTGKVLSKPPTYWK